MKVLGRELAPSAIIEIMEHYISRLSLEVNEIRFIDDFEDDIAVGFDPDDGAIIMNFARIPTLIFEHGWSGLIFHSALWAVQISSALVAIRTVVQEQYYGFEKMNEEELDYDIELFIGQELRGIAAKDSNLFMPTSLDKMGIIGERVKSVLENSGDIKDVASWECGGAVDTEEFRKFLKPEVIDNLQNAIRSMEFGRYTSGFCFLTIAEYLSLVVDDELHLTEEAAELAAHRSKRLAERLENFDADLMSEAAKEAVEEGSTDVEIKVDASVSEVDLASIAVQFSGIKVEDEPSEEKATAEESKEGIDLNSISDTFKNIKL